jgi:hypothetical protein
VSTVEKQCLTVNDGVLRSTYTMKARFVSIPAEALRARLAAADFRLVPADRSEEVYERAHGRDPRYVVRVCSSVPRGEAEARDRGTDAIRIVALLRQVGGVAHVYTAPRVHRSGTVERVLDRVIERAQEAYAAIDRHRLMRHVAELAHEVMAKRLGRELRRRSP